MGSETSDAFIFEVTLGLVWISLPGQICPRTSPPQRPQELTPLAQVLQCLLCRQIWFKKLKTYFLFLYSNILHVYLFLLSHCSVLFANQVFYYDPFLFYCFSFSHYLKAGLSAMPSPIALQQNVLILSQSLQGIFAKFIHRIHGCDSFHNWKQHCHFFIWFMYGSFFWQLSKLSPLFRFQKFNYAMLWLCLFEFILYGIQSES